MILIKVDSKYTEYLRSFDDRVSFNKDNTYERHYVGVLLKIKENIMYFAPLTSSGKGLKLKTHPKRESITFYPIKECALGGINFNNMIPVIEGVYKKVDILNIKDFKFKILLINQVKELNKKENHLKNKAHIIRNLKLANKLYPNYDKVTCDFKLLEDKATEYKK